MNPTNTLSETTVFIEPLDVLSLRGNRLFGDPGSWGETLMPPPPSVVAGALRTHLLVQAGVDLTAFAEGRHEDRWVGTRDRPGPFTITAFHLARRSDGTIEPLFPLSADLVVHGGGGQTSVLRLQPTRVEKSIQGSVPLPFWTALPESRERRKPDGGPRWLTAEGFRRWLKGEHVEACHLVQADKLWGVESRVGVGLDYSRRRAEDGKLFTLQAVSFRPDCGFAVCVAGAEIPGGVIRLGGDGHAARVQEVPIDWPKPDYESLASTRRAQLLLTSPGIFPLGWLPTGAGEPDPAGGAPFALGNVRGRLVCAAVSRAQVVSGFDLAAWRPKPAQRAAPVGSVYWIDELEATADDLRALVKRGLWTESQHASDPRRAEGFNRFVLASWPHTD